jgi:SAM-dependent methyltransferase
MPFLEKQLQAAGAKRVLDTACGTGIHAIALAQNGFDVSGADLSAGMVERAQENAHKAGVEVRFEKAGFGELASAFGMGTFEAVLCLGNSLPHVLTQEGLSAALVDFADCLKPGGLVLIQNRNFDAVMEQRARWMEPQAANEGDSEWLFLRFYDFEPDGLLTFNVVTLHRDRESAWTQSIRTAQLRPWQAGEMHTVLKAAGFASASFFGDMTGAPFDASASGNLVAYARLAGK